MRAAGVLMTTGVLLGALASPGAADTWRPLQVWRIDEGRLAPWAEPGTRVDPSYRGRQVRFELTRLAAMRPLACDGATYEWLVVAPEGLFEGHLPAPQADAARRLGLAEASIPTLRVRCSNASFDFHRTSDGALLLGLDHVVWTLRPLSRPTTAPEVVQELLLAHFTHDMAFSPASVGPKRPFLSAALQAAIDGYLRQPQPPDEPPAINGDPFTDTQEYPDRFTLGVSRSTAQRTVVPVHFAGGQLKRRVDYVLVREQTRWVVDDVVDERGQSLRTLLRPAY